MYMQKDRNKQKQSLDDLSKIKQGGAKRTDQFTKHKKKQTKKPQEEDEDNQMKNDQNYQNNETYDNDYTEDSKTVIQKQIVDVKQSDAAFDALFNDDEEDDFKPKPKQEKTQFQQPIPILQQKMQQEEEISNSVYGSKEQQEFEKYNNLNKDSKKRKREDFEQKTTEDNIKQMTPIKNQKEQPIVESYLDEDSNTNFSDIQNMIEESEKKKQQHQYDLEEDSINFEEINQIINEHSAQKTQVENVIDEPKEIIKQVENVSTLEEHQLKSYAKGLQDIVVKDGEFKDSINLYFIDIHEDYGSHPGQIFIVGKALNHENNSYESITLVIEKSVRNIYFAPKNQEDFDQKKMEDEIHEKVKKYFSSSKRFQCTGEFVKRKYAFELPLQYGESLYYKLKYDFEFGALPADFNGQNFSCILGTSYTPLELFLIKKEIKGPQWINITKFSENRQQDHSHTKFEIRVGNINAVTAIEPNKQMPPPPLKVMSLAIKTTRPNKIAQQEIVQISTIIHNKVEIDKNTKNDGNNLKFTSFIRKIKDSKQFPYDFDKKKQNTCVVLNEYALFDAFLQKMKEWDPDVIVGHDLYNSVFDIIGLRIQRLKIKNWSRFGKLKSQKDIPKSGSQMFKTRIITKGRLLVDTYTNSKELIRGNDYDLTTLVKSQLDQKRQEIDQDNIPGFYEKTEHLMEMIKHTEVDAKYILDLMFKLQILPLTKQLTSICGNVWIRSLQNARAERNEMLLMHQFHQKKFIIPDKYKKFELDKLQDEEEDQPLMNAEPETKKANGRKKAQYGGGLVLEPKSGLYDDMILMLDFNSLYPSIIQEYNVCFTTVKRKSIELDVFLKKYDKKKEKGNKNLKDKDIMDVENKEQEEEEVIPKKPDEGEPTGVLPQVIKYLVERRKQVKNQLKKASSEDEATSLDIKQKAFKLVANSMYGCLGFSSSRFYAKPIAALITYSGRSILQDAIKTVQSLNYEVIYGDTDSLFISPKKKALGDLLQVGMQIKKEVSKKYKNLVFDIDGVYKSFLLLKKKKYAALKLDNFDKILLNSDVEPIWKREEKGLDLVRRDWCDLSRKAGNIVLQKILYCQDKEELFEEIAEFLKKLNSQIEGGQVNLSDFFITKQLSKNPSDYPEGKGLPHVAVAKRAMKNGASANSLINHIIYYAITKGTSNNLADRAFSPEEINKENKVIDYEYYKGTQILPPIMRMCGVIEGMISEKLAESLGLDGTKYKNKNLADGENAQEEVEEQNYELKIPCQGCKQESTFSGRLRKEEGSSSSINGIICSECKSNRLNKSIFENKVKLLVRKLIKDYYKCEFTHTGQNAECQSLTVRQIMLHDLKCPFCGEETKPAISEMEIHNSIKAIRKIFDPQSKNNTKNNDTISAEDAEFFNKIYYYIEGLYKKSSYDIINLQNIFKTLKLL